MKKITQLVLFFLLWIPHAGFSYYSPRPCCGKLQACGWWGSADYLLLYRKRRFFPALVTGNPTTVPVLSNPTTEILFGDQFKGGGPKCGAQADFGIWFSRCLAIGTGFFTGCEDKITFDKDGGPSGVPIFGRPFFDTLLQLQDVELISFPALFLNGHIDIEANNRFWGWDTYLRYRFLCSPCFRFDLLGGFMATHLNDNLLINTRSTGPFGPTTTSVFDKFSAENEYLAGLVGLYAEWRSCSWAFTLTGKLGLGCVDKKVAITGETTTTVGGITTVVNGGLLAQPSNIGEFKHKKFEAIPKIDAKLQLKICRNLWATVGYTYIFWPAVALAGEQVNLNINPTQVPGPVVGTPEPRFVEQLTSFWAQAFSAGIYMCY